MLHPTEKYYPLRPEFAESTFYLYQATKGLMIVFISNLHFHLGFNRILNYNASIMHENNY